MQRVGRPFTNCCPLVFLSRTNAFLHTSLLVGSHSPSLFQVTKTGGLLPRCPLHQQSIFFPPAPHSSSCLEHLSFVFLKCWVQDETSVAVKNFNESKNNMRIKRFSSKKHLYFFLLLRISCCYIYKHPSICHTNDGIFFVISFFTFWGIYFKI